MSQINGSELDYLNGLVKNTNKGGVPTRTGSFDSLFAQPQSNPSGFSAGGGSYTRGSGLPALGYTQQIQSLGPFKQFARPGGPGSGGPNAITTARGALSGDIAAQQAAEQYNHGREVAQYNETMGQIRGAPNRINQATDRQVGMLVDAAGQAEALGDQQVKDFYNRADDIMSGLEDTTAMQASAGLRGMARSNDMATKLANKGFDSQGSPLTDAQQADQQYQLGRESDQQKQEFITGLFSNFNQLKSQLATQLEGIGSSVLGGQRDLTTLASNLKAQAATAIQANQQFVEQLQLQGNTAMANYLTQSRFSPTSWFSGITALWNMASAPGGRNVRLS